MVSPEKFSQLQNLPFSDGKFTNLPQITKPITFALEKDEKKLVTLFPIHDWRQVPESLIRVLQDEFNYVVEEGLTYPYENTMNYDEFVQYWFKHFVAILLEGEFEVLPDLSYDEFKSIFLGNFYVKPNYIGRCSHVCNGGFIVNHNKRGLGIGKEMGKKYLLWAPQLGYVYSVFNLVFDTNVASMKIWDSLGFERIGYVKNVAVLKGINRLVGAHMYGKDL